MYVFPQIDRNSPNNEMLVNRALLALIMTVSLVPIALENVPSNLASFDVENAL